MTIAVSEQKKVGTYTHACFSDIDACTHVHSRPDACESMLQRHTRACLALANAGISIHAQRSHMQAFASVCIVRILHTGEMLALVRLVQHTFRVCALEDTRGALNCCTLVYLCACGHQWTSENRCLWQFRLTSTIQCETN